MAVTIESQNERINFSYLYYYTHYTSYTYYVSGGCSPKNLGTARVGLTLGPFCSVQLFGAGPHQAQGCAAGLLQSVSDENVLWKSSNGPSHDSAAGYR